MSTCKYEPWSLKDLSNALNDMHIDRKQIVVPMFQRGKRWKNYQEETFIDSLTKGYPVGTMLFYRKVLNNREVYTLVDGLQRGNTIKKYMASPTKYFKATDIPEKVILQIYEILGLSGQEQIIKLKISEIIVTMIHGWKSYSGMQYYSIAKEITSTFTSSNKSALEKIIDILQSFLDEYKDLHEKISTSTIPVIIYSGDEDTLPDIFDRINSKGTPLTQYEVYAASWPINDNFRVSNTEIVEKVLRKYDTLADNDYSISGYDRDSIRRSQMLNSFEYLFGLSKYLNEKYNILNFDKKSQDDDINPMAFELVNACFNESDKIKTLYNIILKIDINEFETKLTQCIEFVSKIIQPITRFKSNSRTESKILHSKYQILSMISTTFKEKYDVTNNCLAKSTWKNTKKILNKHMLQHYVYDIISNEWSDGGTNKIYKVGKPNKYMNIISYQRWDALLESYFEQTNIRQESKKVPFPSKEDIIILNCIYLKLFTAMDQLSLNSFDIEHIATKQLMKDKLGNISGSGLPISSIGNLCFLPQNINRSKQDKTFYQDKNYLKFIDLRDVENKYSFTIEADLKWVELDYTTKNYEVLKSEYTNYLRKRFNKQKYMFYNALEIDTSEDIEEIFFEKTNDEKATSIIKINTDKSPSAFHEQCARKISEVLSITLNKNSNTFYSSIDGDIGVIINVSKAYSQGGNPKYWFSYHPKYKKQLEEFKTKYIAFGCGSSDQILLFSLSDIEENKLKMNHSLYNNRLYWHVKFHQYPDRWAWKLSNPTIDYLDITSKLL